LGNRVIEKCAVGGLKLFAHRAPLDGARAAVQRNGDGWFIGGWHHWDPQQYVPAVFH